MIDVTKRKTENIDFDMLNIVLSGYTTDYNTNHHDKYDAIYINKNAWIRANNIIMRGDSEKVKSIVDTLANSIYFDAYRSLNVAGNYARDTIDTVTAMTIIDLMREQYKAEGDFSLYSNPSCWDATYVFYQGMIITSAYLCKKNIGEFKKKYRKRFNRIMKTYKDLSMDGKMYVDKWLGSGLDVKELKMELKKWQDYCWLGRQLALVHMTNDNLRKEELMGYADSVIDEYHGKDFDFSVLMTDYWDAAYSEEYGDKKWECICCNYGALSTILDYEWCLDT